MSDLALFWPFRAIKGKYINFRPGAKFFKSIGPLKAYFLADICEAKEPMQTEIQDLAEQSGCLRSDMLIAKVNVAETAASTSASRNERSERWESSV